MGEHVFDNRGDAALDDASATERAAELAEGILDEIARAQHSWRAIELMASGLMRLAALMARPSRPRPDPSTPRA